MNKWIEDWTIRTIFEIKKRTWTLHRKTGNYGQMIYQIASSETKDGCLKHTSVFLSVDFLNGEITSIPVLDWAFPRNQELRDRVTSTIRIDQKLFMSGRIPNNDNST